MEPLQMRLCQHHVDTLVAVRQLRGTLASQAYSPAKPLGTGDPTFSVAPGDDAEERQQRWFSAFFNRAEPAPDRTPRAANQFVWIVSFSVNPPGSVCGNGTIETTASRHLRKTN